MKILKSSPPITERQVLEKLRAGLAPSTPEVWDTLKGQPMPASAPSQPGRRRGVLPSLTCAVLVCAIVLLAFYLHPLSHSSTESMADKMCIRDSPGPSPTSSTAKPMTHPTPVSVWGWLSHRQVPAEPFA